MKLTLQVLGITQPQALDLLSMLEDIEADIATAIAGTTELTPQLREKVMLSLRSAPAQLNHIRHQLNLNS